MRNQEVRKKEPKMHIYKVTYNVLKIKSNGLTASKPYGTDVAYMDCKIDEVDPILNAFLTKKCRSRSRITKVTRITGDIIPTDGQKDIQGN